MALVRPVMALARLWLLLAMVAVLAVTGCTQKEPKISIEGPYAVLSEMFYGSASVFMNIRNTGGRDALLSVAVDIPGAVVEMHDIDGKRMFKVDRLEVPARGTLELKPLGRHLMIFNMPQSIREGSTAIVKLVFERSGVKNVPLRFVRFRDIPGNW